MADGCVRSGQDVGWIGNGGSQYAFDSVQVVADGIEQNSDGRRYIWTVCGWAGTHRNAVMWTGDDSGSFEYIRWQRTTFVGTGFSAQAHVSGDIDVQFAGGIVVEKQEWLRTYHGNVVTAHGDKIDTNGVVSRQLHGEAEFRAHSIGA